MTKRVFIDGNEYELVKLNTLIGGLDEDIPYALKPIPKQEKQDCYIEMWFETSGIDSIFKKELQLTKEEAESIASAIKAMLDSLMVHKVRGINGTTQEKYEAAGKLMNEKSK